jgi:hypothetical protein
VTPAPLEGSKPATLKATLALAKSSNFLPRAPDGRGFAADERFEGGTEAGWGGRLRGKVGLRVE